MSFLDRFKIQPKHKSPDPEVRAAAVTSCARIPAKKTPRPARAGARGRRFAGQARRHRAASTTSRARDDRGRAMPTRRSARDSGAAGRHRRPATAEDARARRWARCRDQKHIANVAKTSPSRRSAPRPSGALTDVKSLSSVARHATDARTAALATERMQDRAELLNIAAKTDHKDAGRQRARTRGGDRPIDRDALEGLATRAKNKSVAKRARAMVQAIDDAETARREALEQHQQRCWRPTLTRIEALAAAPADETAAQSSTSSKPTGAS